MSIPIGLRPDFLVSLTLKCPKCGTHVHYSQSFVIVRLVAVNHWKGDEPLSVDELLLAASMLTKKPWTTQEIEYACVGAISSGLVTKTDDGHFCMNNSQFERYLNTAGRCSKCGSLIYEGPIEA